MVTPASWGPISSNGPPLANFQKQNKNKSQYESRDAHEKKDKHQRRRPATMHRKQAQSRHHSHMMMKFIDNSETPRRGRKTVEGRARIMGQGRNGFPGVEVCVSLSVMVSEDGGDYERRGLEICR